MDCFSIIISGLFLADPRINYITRNLTQSLVQTPAQLRVSCENKPSCSVVYLIWSWKHGRRAMAKSLWAANSTAWPPSWQKMFFIYPVRDYFCFSKLNSLSHIQHHSKDPGSTFLITFSRIILYLNTVLFSSRLKKKNKKTKRSNQGFSDLPPAVTPVTLNYFPFWPEAQSGYLDAYRVVTDFSLKSRISVHVRPSLGIFCPRSWGWGLNPGFERVIQILQLFHVVPVPFPTKPLQPLFTGCCLLVTIRMCFREVDHGGVGWCNVFFQLSLLNPPKWLHYFMPFQEGP